VPDLMSILAPILADITVEEMRGWLTLVDLAGIAGFAFLLGLLTGWLIGYRDRNHDDRDHAARMKHLGGPHA
jgi:hypothetical protein